MAEEEVMFVNTYTVLATVCSVAKFPEFRARYMMLPEHRKIFLTFHFYWMRMRETDTFIDWIYIYILV
jgi:hypothetical protein